MRTYTPRNDEILAAVMKFQKIQSDIGVRKLYQHIIDENKVHDSLLMVYISYICFQEWKLSQKTFRSFFMQNVRNSSPIVVQSYSDDVITEEYEIVEDNFVCVDDLESDCVLVNCVTAATS